MWLRGKVPAVEFSADVARDFGPERFGICLLGDVVEGGGSYLSA